MSTAPVAHPPTPRASRLSSLRWRLSAATSGVVLLCVAVCVAAAVIFLHRALTDRASADLQRTLRGVSGYLRNQRGELLGAASLVADNPAVRADVEGYDRQQLIVDLTPYYADLTPDVLDVVDASGRVLVRMEDTSDPWAYGDVVSPRSGARAALAGRSVTAFEADLPGHEAAGGYGLRAAVPLRDGSRIIGAVVVGQLLGSDFAAQIGDALDSNVNLIAGAERTGTTLTDRNGLPATGLPEPRSVLARIADGRVSVAQVDEGGQTALSGVVPLFSAAGRPVGAVEVVSPLSPLYDVVTGLSFLLLALGVVVALVGTGLALGLSRRLTRRLLALEAVAAQVAAAASSDAPLADLHGAVSVQGADEVASLARSLAAMMQALDERLLANARLYAAAQARVRELTGLAEIARLLTAAPSLQETLDTLGEQVCRLVGCPAAAIVLPGEEWTAAEGAPTSVYGGYGLPDGYGDIVTATLLPPADDGFQVVPRLALASKQMAWRRIADIPDGYTALRGLAQRAGWGGVTAVPLCLHDRAVGVLSCYTAASSPLPDSDVSLLTTIADQVAVAVENARLHARSLDVAALQERQRLARELHDSVSQALYAIALGTRTAQALLERDPARAAEPLEYVLSMAEAGLTEMRALIFELRPEALATEGLVGALDKQVAFLRARHGITVEASLGSEPDAPPGVKEAVYRIAQEALHNTLKHAHARKVVVQLCVDSSRIKLQVADDGTGFDPQGEFPGHLGLRTMRERALRLGGALSVESAPGAGTRIYADIPVPAAAGLT